MIKTREIERNLLLLDFILNIPIRNQEICNLKISDIDSDNMLIQLLDREVPITKPLLERLHKYLEERLTRGIECQYIFCRKYDGVMDKMTESSISELIDKAVNRCSFSESRKKEIDLRFIRGNVIYRYVYQGEFSLEEVMKIADCKLATLDTYINIDKIKLETTIPIEKIEKYSKRYFKKYHPLI